MVVTALLIDTSLEQGFAAVAHGENLLFELPLIGRESAQELLPLLQAALTTHAFKLSILDVIGVAIGPGSYTGLRLGAIMAEALAYALKIPLVGVTSTALYLPPPAFEGSFIVLFDARMGGAYSAVGLQRQGQIDYMPPQLTTLDKLSQQIQQNKLILSPHVPLLQKRLMEMETVFSSDRWMLTTPSPHRLKQITFQEYTAGRTTAHVTNALLYLRDSPTTS